MELFSIQPLWIYEHLQKGQTFRASPALCSADSDEFDESWARAYGWLTREMDKRCSVPRPSGVTYPIWAWHAWAGPQMRKPDLRFESTRHYAQGGPCVLMTLDVPDGEVLLSEFHAWHHVLNSWYLAPGAEADEFEARCEQKGLNPYKDKPLPDTALQAEMETSWGRIFDLDSIPALLEYDKNDSYVQATFWELRPEFAREAIWFEQKGRSRRLALPAC